MDEGIFVKFLVEHDTGNSPAHFYIVAFKPLDIDFFYFLNSCLLATLRKTDERIFTNFLGYVGLDRAKFPNLGAHHAYQQHYGKEDEWIFMEFHGIYSG